MERQQTYVSEKNQNEESNAKDESCSNEIKTTISCPYSFCDVNGQVLPNGNYYFTISKYNDSYCTGSLTAKGRYGEFTFKTIDIVKMMSVAQSRLARRSGLQEDGMPDYISPPISPENSNLTKQLDETDIVHNYFYTPDQCSICLNMISKNRKRLVCSHSFHNLCISKWLATDQRCPICRRIHTEDSRRNRRTTHSNTSSSMEIEEEVYQHRHGRHRNRQRASLPAMNLRHRYNNYVVPRNNYVGEEVESAYTYKK